jgi:hypothetical protein
MVSCAHDQQLVSISIQPNDEIFGSGDIPVPLDAGLSVQLRALGTYIHPPVTKDITNQVTWATDDPQMVTVNSTGLITATGGACGKTLITATVNTNSSAGNRTSSGAIVTATMTAEVVCFSSSGGGAGPFILQVFVSGTGSVSSSPAGINSCTGTTGTCSALFNSGTSIALTAAPIAPATTVVWGPGCTPNSANPLVCDLTLGANTQITATFQ